MIIQLVYEKKQKDPDCYRMGTVIYTSTYSAVYRLPLLRVVKPSKTATIVRCFTLFKLLCLSEFKLST